MFGKIIVREQRGIRPFIGSSDSGCHRDYYLLCKTLRAGIRDRQGRIRHKSPMATVA